MGELPAGPREVRRDEPVDRGDAERAAPATASPGYPPDVVVSVPKDACRSLDFHRAAEMVELGRELAETALRSAEL